MGTERHEAAAHSTINCAGARDAHGDPRSFAIFPSAEDD